MKIISALLFLSMISAAVRAADESAVCNRENLNRSWKGVGADAVPPGLTLPSEARDAEVTYTCTSMRLGTGFGFVWRASWAGADGGKVERVFSEKSGQWGIPLDRR